uniref:Uncharacterized protein n=1 Tax=Nelumbo nucifera TaxID=4432 RepID=A0A822Z2K5_NELNU|nr:TPA_asm: hypothetical protein HUJ06_008572 [Nelumbo nucifera]
MDHRDSGETSLAFFDSVKEKLEHIETPELDFPVQCLSSGHDVPSTLPPSLLLQPLPTAWFSPSRNFSTEKWTGPKAPTTLRSSTQSHKRFMGLGSYTAWMQSEDSVPTMSGRIHGVPSTCINTPGSGIPTWWSFKEKFSSG